MGIWQATQKYFQQALHEITEEQVIELMVNFNGAITSRQLANHLHISRNQAIIKLNAMCIKNLIEIDYHRYDEHWDSYYIIANKTLVNQLQNKPLKFKSKLTDSEVINLAINHQNSLTATLLCAKTGVSIEEAQDKLEELYMKNIFELQVSEKGAVVYVLLEI
jgi:predicted HTH transcriptional regulator